MYCPSLLKAFSLISVQQMLQSGHEDCQHLHIQALLANLVLHDLEEMSSHAAP